LDDAVAIDVDAVGAVQVFQAHAFSADVDPGVHPRHERVLEHQIAFREATNQERTVAKLERNTGAGDRDRSDQRL
jgi:hypothetical protein